MKLLSAPSRRSMPSTSPSASASGLEGTRDIDVAGLEQALREGTTGEVGFDAGWRAMYASDASNFRQVPIGVVVPSSLDDVVAAHRVCARFGAPIVNRGGGTSLSGETVNYAVVIDNSKYLTRIGELDTDSGTVQCQPGVDQRATQPAHRKVGAGVRTRPVVTLAVHDRRQPREQLLWCALGPGAAVRPRAPHVRQH